MKKLQEMNLVDDFLVYSLTAHKVYGEEAARYILECILQRSIRHLTVVPQKTWYGETPEKHGVRLDVCLDEEDGELFDIEPDRTGSSEEVKALPRRARFYHAKIDAGNLTAGESYGTLRNVVVIFITTYDPFGLNRMVYTIKNGCVEVPEMPYEDGAKTLFLYTKGEEGNPPKELRELTRYMEESSGENAQTNGLKRLHEMVTKVKADREVGLAYMKMWESEESIKARATAEATANEKANEILRLLEKCGTVSQEERERILAQRNLQVLEQWHEEAMAKNEQYLTAKIKTESKQETIFLLLSDLGQVPEALKAKILSETRQETLDLWIRAIKRAESIEQFTASVLSDRESL
ncbi:MAG: hypothetical protein HFH93_01955 [Lachnospiraceae bacterium]|nr:hypothetical protein [Lachnospiraceae bacterium]